MTDNAKGPRLFEFFGEDRYETVARYHRRWPDRAAAARLCRAFAARTDRSAASLDPVRHPGVGCRRRVVLSGLSVAQSGHRHRRRDLPAVAAMEAAGDS